MKYLLSALIILLFFTASAANADAPAGKGWRKTHSVERLTRTERFVRVVGDSRYERQLRRDYAAFRAEQDRLNRAERRKLAQEREFARYREARRPQRLRRQDLTERSLYHERRYVKPRAVYVAPLRPREDDEESYRVEERERAEIGTVCKPAVTGQGDQKYTRWRAERDALKSWGSVVARQYGSSYVNPTRARNAHYSCDPFCSTCAQWVCRYRAAPCKGEF